MTESTFFTDQLALSYSNLTERGANDSSCLFVLLLDALYLAGYPDRRAILANPFGSATD